jgi:hypothetical protein
MNVSSFPVVQVVAQHDTSPSPSTNLTLFYEVLMQDPSLAAQGYSSLLDMVFQIADLTPFTP